MNFLSEEEQLILKMLWQKMDRSFFRSLYVEMFHLNPEFHTLFKTNEFDKFGNMFKKGLRTIAESEDPDLYCMRLKHFHKDKGVEEIDFRYMRIAILNVFNKSEEFNKAEIDVWLKVFDYTVRFLK